MQELLQFVYYKEEEWTKDIYISIWTYCLLFTKKKKYYVTGLPFFGLIIILITKQVKRNINLNRWFGFLLYLLVLYL